MIRYWPTFLSDTTCRVDKQSTNNQPFDPYLTIRSMASLARWSRICHLTVVEQASTGIEYAILLLLLGADLSFVYEMATTWFPTARKLSKRNPKLLGHVYKMGTYRCVVQSLLQVSHVHENVTVRKQLGPVPNIRPFVTCKNGVRLHPAECCHHLWIPQQHTLCIQLG